MTTYRSVDGNTSELLSERPSEAGRSLRIVHYLRHVQMESGGVVRLVLDLAALTAKSGHEVALITRNPRDCPPEWAEHKSGVHIPNVCHFAGIPRISSIQRIRTVIDGADVVHIHSLWGLDDALVAGMARQLGRPYVISLHGVLDLWSLSQQPVKKRTYLGTVGRIMLRHAAAVHCTAQEELRQARLTAPIKNPVVIPCALDLSPFLSAGAAASTVAPMSYQSRHRLLFLSRLHPKKGLHHLVRAVGKLKVRGFDISLDIAGSGDSDYRSFISREIARLGLRSQVRFLGHVTEPSRSMLLAASDIMILPTSQENFGLVLLESLAAGTPVVTTTGVDIHRELSATGAASIVDVKQSADAFVEDLTDAIEVILNGGIEKSVILRAQRSVERWLNPHRVTDAYLEMYESVAL